MNLQKIKTLGGTLGGVVAGFLVGGPPGALVGAAAGGAYDYYRHKKLTAPIVTPIGISGVALVTPSPSAKPTLAHITIKHPTEAPVTPAAHVVALHNLNASKSSAASMTPDQIVSDAKTVLNDLPLVFTDDSLTLNHQVATAALQFLISNPTFDNLTKTVQTLQKMSSPEGQAAAAQLAGVQ